jgi:hypothetical protein
MPSSLRITNKTPWAKANEDENALQRGSTPYLPPQAFGGVVMRRIGLNSCPYCGGLEVFRSHPRTWLDRACVFLFRFARCHLCLHHYYRPLLLPPLEYPNAAGKKTTQPTSKDEKQKRTG